MVISSLAFAGNPFPFVSFFVPICLSDSRLLKHVTHIFFWRRGEGIHFSWKSPHAYLSAHEICWMQSLSFWLKVKVSLCLFFYFYSFCSIILPFFTDKKPKAVWLSTWANILNFEKESKHRAELSYHLRKKSLLRTHNPSLFIFMRCVANCMCVVPGPIWIMTYYYRMQFMHL